MKSRINLTLAAILASSTAMAGGMAEPVMTMEPVMVMEETASSSGDLLIPLILVALLAAAASSGDGGGEGFISDARVKTDILPVGTAINGLPLSQYRYAGSSTVFEGVMAQDVLMHTPEAVVTHPSGLMAVNYDMLGIQLKVID